MNRRTALLTSTALAASRVLGANDRLRGAIIGAGGRGRYLSGEFKEIGVEMAAVCDIYEANLQAGLKVAASNAKPYDNYRKMLEDKSIDVVVVATPDHWHARMVIDAVEAGKDVYVEKPMAHTIPEGFDVINAVRRTKRIVQVGTQRRSFDLFQQAKSMMDSGQLGEIRLVTSHWYNHQASLSSRQLQGKLNWKEWLGSAPPRDLDEKRFFNWYYYWDYSGGLLVGQAAHVMDAINWFMNSKEPSAVTCSGGKSNLGAEVPETASMIVEYPENYIATFTLGYKAMRYNSFNDQMKNFHGHKARFDVWREGYALYPEDAKAIDMKPSAIEKRPGSFGPASRAHIRNFLECARSRKEPNAPVEAGQATNIILCMAMDSLRSGRRLKWNSAARKVEV